MARAKTIATKTRKPTVRELETRTRVLVEARLATVGPELALRYVGSGLDDAVLRAAIKKAVADWLETHSS